MTRFVTGGAGFIGANYLFYLRAHYPDDRLVCIDKLTYAGNLSTLAKQTVILAFLRRSIQL